MSCVCPQSTARSQLLGTHVILHHDFVDQSGAPDMVCVTMNNVIRSAKPDPSPQPPRNLATLKVRAGKQGKRKWPRYIPSALLFASTHANTARLASKTVLLPLLCLLRVKPYLSVCISPSGPPPHPFLLSARLSCIWSQGSSAYHRSPAGHCRLVCSGQGDAQPTSSRHKVTSSLAT